jgi:peptidoglycan/LPS O-acetylase OafA/YrhL
MLWTVLALLCIILGFVSAIVEEQILIPTLAWFVAAIAFNTLGGISAFTFTKRSE